MKNIFVFEDDPLFIRQIKRNLSETNVRYFDSSNSFFKEYKSDSINLIKTINDTKIFFLDFWIDKKESIVSTGILEIILNNKSEYSLIYFISNEEYSLILSSINNFSLKYTPKFEHMIGKDVSKIKEIIMC